MAKRYYATHGTLKGYARGFYILKAESIKNAIGKLRRKLKGRGVFNEHEVQTVWAGVKSAVGQVKRGASKYYVALGNDIYYFEV